TRGSVVGHFDFHRDHSRLHLQQTCDQLAWSHQYLPAPSPVSLTTFPVPSISWAHWPPPGSPQAALYKSKSTERATAALWGLTCAVVSKILAPSWEVPAFTSALT